MMHYSVNSVVPDSVGLVVLGSVDMVVAGSSLWLGESWFDLLYICLCSVGHYSKNI